MRSHATFLLTAAPATAVLLTHLQRFSAIGPLPRAYAPVQQVPLGPNRVEDAVYHEKGQNWPIFWQDNRTCAANASQFTGKVPVGEGKSLFFWFVESRENSREKPTVLWLNGGPGASSMVGLFEEIGPCEFRRDGNRTITAPNPHSWAEFANLLFIDQPAGVGFSTSTNNSSPPVKTLAQSTNDLIVFLQSFVKSFPEYFGHGFHLAGESFAGRYIPRLASSLARDGFSLVQVDSIILVDALVDGAFSAQGHYDMFCTEGGVGKGILHFNATACDTLAAAVVEGERLRRLCQVTGDAFVCGSAVAYANAYEYVWFQEEVDARRRSPYDLRLGCELPPNCIPPSEFSVESHFNDAQVQKLLGIDVYTTYQAINFVINDFWGNQAEINLPTTQDLVYLLDEADVRVLAMSGNYDVVLSAPGAWREYNDLPWSKNLIFQLAPREDWYFSDMTGGRRKGGERKMVARQLQFAGVDGAGHMAPGDQRESVASLVREWIEG